ncbi:hypothetical protein R4R92_004622 [Citrobacter freundii]|nr:MULTISPECIES: hypothetical protein [Citrobacter]EFL9618726.1 hypothetical protein [Escherichia coli]EGT5658372.1 hypothetical protein [Citrobacter braakii]EIQ9245483.1 hypothetical protein [Escherichia coli]ELK1249931.1 hypothetical protein [Citrobacter freundii]ELK6451403.1 hypothetical protein [Citrobacter freundii]
MKKIISLGILCAAVSTGVSAAEISKTGITDIAPVDSGCTVKTDTMGVVAVQFSKSGMTLDLIQFLNADKSIMAMPTDFENAGFSTLQQSQANNFIKLGSFYKVHYQLCGQAGYPTLLDIHTVK